MDEAMTEALQKARRTDNPNKIDFETLQMLIWWTQNALNDIHGFKKKDGMEAQGEVKDKE